MFLHLENGVQENMTWDEKKNLKIKKQPIREAPPSLAGKREIPEVLETLWQCNS